MRVLVSGGRDFTNRTLLFRVLDDLHETTPISVIIHGKNRKGADAMVDQWAKLRQVRLETYPANWDKYGNDAGPIRNLQMIEEGKPDLVVAFPTGGPGTANMMQQARREGLQVTEITDDE